jgi:hypothetical protein
MGISANLSASSVYGGAQHAQVVGNPNVPGNFAANPGCIGPTKLRNITYWYNPCAFVRGCRRHLRQRAAVLLKPAQAALLRHGHLAFEVDKHEAIPFACNSARSSSTRSTMSTSERRLSTTPGTGSAGSITLADIPRQIQFAAKFYW